MAGIFLKWFIPALLTVAGGTALAIAGTDRPASTDLANRAKASLAGNAGAWGQVSIDGRDAILTGTAVSQGAIDAAVSRLESVHGIRAVTAKMVVAELASPFVFSASVQNGTIHFDGGYPSTEAHAALLAAAAGAIDATRLLSGGPDSGAYIAAAKYGLDALKQLDKGEIRLSDLSLSIAGRARSSAAFDALQTMQHSVPAGVTLAGFAITPALASPYVWSAKFDGAAVKIEGDAPDSGLADKLRAAAPAAIAVSTSLQLASGEPSAFEANTLALLASLLRLQSGVAEIKDGTISLTGAPTSVAIASEVTAHIQKLGGTATLEPVAVADYAFGIEKSAGHLAFSGNVPDAATRDRLAGFAGAEISALQLGRGAPERFASGLDFGLRALSLLAEGKFEIKADRLGLFGRASSVADYKTAVKMVAEGAPQGLTLTAQLRPPIAKPFLWSAVKAASGAISMSGDMPDEAARAALLAKIKILGSDASDPADGAPEGFTASAAKGLDVLALLDAGAVRFDGAAWAIEGVVDSAAKGLAADAVYSAAGLAGADWSYTVGMPADAKISALGSSTVEDIVSLAPIAAASSVSPGVELAVSSSAESSAPPASSQEPASVEPPPTPISSQPSPEPQAASTADELSSSSTPPASSSTPPASSAPSSAMEVLSPLEACIAQVGALAKRNAIAFLAGKTTLTAESLPVIDELAVDLAVCPDANVHVEAHTDADGAAAANLALSVARAEAVSAALVARGVRDTRIYAEGFGESDPVGSNDTKQGKILNRRIGFTITKD